MQHHTRTLLFSPINFFSSFEEKKIRWLPSLVGFYSCGLAALLGCSVWIFRPVISSVFVFYLILGSAVVGATAALVVGLFWLWGTSRLFGSRVRLLSSLRATGVALAWPGIATSVLYILAILGISFDKDVAWFLVVFLQILIMIWLLWMLCASARGLHHFGWTKVFIVVFSPLLLGAVFGIFTQG